ncbi:DNA cytosine methyltransferase [Lactobacillus delbrueckii subsp. bulgaricus]|jgi:DNA (cytosine-5)-methyltransferase 1|uniref:DNA cytosine methyltransferase n=1 Tax=Lactobacillus delbrueckii TaxID=1584 RepID=UPI000E599BD8|nr:DNA cytosine methyltransferase [Lactobacillus delbrueckii]MCD5481155.1 DNA cytosine methyltransferase [Lactobacillus delbrueckii subsp. bulgaricus]RHX65175.1 DNA (cytosine-5-)-methyltransferase [Lactobacillus delbrueckii]
MSKTYFMDNVNTVNAENVTIPENAKPINVVSLFSGCGGMDLGFRGDFSFLGKKYTKNPFNIIFSNDIFKQAADMYEDNFGLKVERRDVKELDTDKDFPDEEVDVVLGGFPCQTFSYAGKRKGLSDPRGQLYLQMIRVVDHYKPKMFIAENVDGIRNSRTNIDGEHVDTSALDTILQDFDSHGYNVQYHVLLAADYGVPQMRRRVIIMGIRKDLGDITDEYYPAQLYDETGEITGRKWLTAKDAIDDLWGKENKTTIPNHTSRDISKAKFYPGRKMQGNNRIQADRPSPTIRAEHHGNIEAHYRYTKEDPNDMSGWRRLSVRECARLQSFPDSYNFTASASSAYKAIGNAVPPVLAWNIARSVYYTLSRLEK